MQWLKKYGLYIAIILAIGIGFWGYRFYKTNYTNNVKTDGYFFIRTGANYADVLLGLEAQGLITNINSFDAVAKRKGYDTKVKPGRYKVVAGSNNTAIVNMLLSGNQAPVNVTINAWRTKKDLAGRIGRVLETDSIALLTMLNDPSFCQSLGFNTETIISLFIPNTYEFFWNTDVDGVIKRMQSEYKKFWTEKRKAQAKALNLSQAEVATLASIVEKESNMKAERPTIAGVYLNRLRKGMKLQADPTVVYAVGDFTLRRILNKHLATNSPYNTYMYVGLPPGPICIPSISSIDAVLENQKHSYIYFCAKEDFSGYHNFAATYSQHLANAAKFQAAMNERGIR